MRCLRVEKTIYLSKFIRIDSVVVLLNLIRKEIGVAIKFISLLNVFEKVNKSKRVTI